MAPPNQWYFPYMFVFVLFTSVQWVFISSYMYMDNLFSYHSVLLTLCLSGPCLFTSSSSSFSTLSPVGPDSPLKCFAKAGKMEPNHLLNGFGPLQPAVAMLWWLQGAPFAVMPSTQSLQWQQAASWWFSTNNIWSVWWFSCSMLKLSDFWLINKPIPASNFGMVHFPDWVLPLCLQREC